MESPKPIMIAKESFWRKNRRKILIFSPFVLLIIVSGLIWLYASLTKVTDNTIVDKTAKNNNNESLLNGVKTTPEIAHQRVVAAMIENSPAARPQVGLTSADVVYEAVTEGGITRFMALYQQNLPDKAGPIRSARSYFIDYLSEYDGIYVHEGGSPTALARISQFAIKDYPNPKDGTYRRESQIGVASEHTLFANIGKIFTNAISGKKNWSATTDFKPWIFKDAAATPTEAGDITVNFSTNQFQVVWVFDKTKNLYLRQLAGIAHKDRITGEQISASTIIVMTVAHSANKAYAGTGKESEWSMSTIGDSPASIFEDGTRTDGNWRKSSRTERTRFYDGDSQEIKLNRGKIWIEIIPQDGSVKVATSSST